MTSLNALKGIHPPTKDENTTTPLSVKHLTLLNRQPSYKQLEIYNKSNHFRGVISNSFDTEVLEALLVLALLSGNYKSCVYLLAPPDMESWIFERLSEFADTVIQGAERYPNKAQIAQGYGTLFKKLRFTGRVLQFPSEPEHWVAFGFSEGVPVPDWMKGKLLPSERLLRSAS